MARMSHDKKPGTKRENKRHETVTFSALCNCSLWMTAVWRYRDGGGNAVKARTLLHLSTVWCSSHVGAGADFRGIWRTLCVLSLAYINHPQRSQVSLALLWLSLCYGSSLRLLYSLRIIRTKLNWTQLGGIIRHSAGRPDTWRVIKGLVLPFDAKWKKMASLSPADCCLASFTWISRPSRHCAADCERVVIAPRVNDGSRRLWRRITAREKHRATHGHRGVTHLQAE